MPTEASDSFSDVELAAFLDETLGAERSAAIETNARGSEVLRGRLSRLRDRHVAGYHTIGQIWRARRISCPGDEAIRRYVADPNDPAVEPVRFHVQIVGCRRCEAEVDALRNQTADDQAERRERLFASSAGWLRRSN